MTQFKKSLLVASIVVAGTALVAPTFVGMNLEAQVKQQVHNLNDTVGYKAKVVEYRNSWFNSSAIIELSFDTDAANSATSYNDQPVGLGELSTTVTMTASHGPVLVDNGLSLGWLSLNAQVDGKAISNHIDVLDDLPLYQIDTHTNLLGQHTFQDKLAQFNFDCSECEHPLEFTVQPYSGMGEVKSDLVTYQGQGADMVFYTQQGELNISGIDMTFTGEVPVEELFTMGMYDSDGKINIQNMVFTKTSGDVALSMRGLSLETWSKVDETSGFADLAVAYSLAEFVDGKNNGRDFDFEMQFKQIDSEFFAAYDSFLKESAAAMDSSVEGASNNQELTNIMDNFLQTHVLALLKAEPQMLITKLNGEFDQGKFNGQMNSQLVGIDAIPEDISNKHFWVAHTVADAKLAGDKALFQHWAALTVASQIRANPQAQGMPEEQIIQIAQQQSSTVVNSLLQQGLLKEDGTQYVALVSLKDLELKVNDKPMPLPI